MALKIRLSRAGAKKRPYFRIVVTDSRHPRDGRYIERLGSYDPMLPKDSPDRVKLDGERVQHWLGIGARPSDRVARFLGQAEIIPMPPRRDNPKKAKPKAKAQARLEAEKEKAAAAAEAAKEAEAAPEAAPEPAPEPAAEPAAEAAAEASAESESPSESQTDDDGASAPEEKSEG